MNYQNKENKKTESDCNRTFRGSIFISSVLVCFAIICSFLILKQMEPEAYKHVRSWYFNNLSVNAIDTQELIDQVSEGFSSKASSFKTCILDILCSITS